MRATEALLFILRIFLILRLFDALYSDHEACELKLNGRILKTFQLSVDSLFNPFSFFCKKKKSGKLTIMCNFIIK